MSRRRQLLGGLAVFAASVLLAVVAVMTLVHPDPVTVFRYGQQLGNSDIPGLPVPFYWSLRTHDRDGWQRLELEGGAGIVLPERVRIVGPDGTTVVDRPTHAMERGRSLGVCNQRDPLGERWWSHDVGPDMLASFRRRDGRYRLETLLRDGWRPVVLFDTGCRTLDVGRG